MKSTTFILFLILTSALLFAPALQSRQKVELAPQTPMTLLLEVKSTTIQLTSDIKTTVLMNISYITADGSQQILQTNAQLVESYQLTVTTTGTYQLTVLSPTFGFVYIDQGGITTYQLIYYTILTIAFLYVFNKKFRIIG